MSCDQSHDMNMAGIILPSVSKHYDHFLQEMMPKLTFSKISLLENVNLGIISCKKWSQRWEADNEIKISGESAAKRKRRES